MGQHWLGKRNKSTLWLTSIILIITLILGEKCASSTSLLDDFPTLAFDKKVNFDDNLDHIVEESLKEFQSNLRRELGLTPNSIISADAEPLPFEPKDDFYFYNNINVDSGATEQMWINYITTNQNQSFPSNGLFLDLDSIEFGGNVINLATTDSGLIMTEHQLNGRETIKDTSKFEIRGIIATEAFIMQNTTTNSEELVLFVLKQNGNLKALTWYSWRTESRKLHYNNGIKVDGFTSSIKLIRIPVTGDYMVAALQKNSVAMYMVDVQDGAVRLKLCNEIDAMEVTAVEPFSINGQLYLAVGNGRANVSYIWKYIIDKEDFQFHQSLEDVNVTDLEYCHRGYEHYLAVVATDTAVIYRWEGALFLRIQSITTSTAQIPVKWQAVHHKYAYPRDVTLLLISPSEVSQYVWNKYMGQFTQVEGTECVSWSRTRNMKGTILPTQTRSSEPEAMRNDCIRLGRSCSGIVHRDTSWHLVAANSTSERIITGRIQQKLIQPANKCWAKLNGPSISVISFLINDDYHGLIIASGRMSSFYQLYVASRPTPRSRSLDIPDIRALEMKLKEQEIVLQRTIDAFEAMQSAEKTSEPDAKPNLEEVCPDVKVRMQALEDRIEEVKKKISSSENRTVYLEGSQKFGTITVRGETIIEGNAKVKYVNNLDMPHFFQDSVMKKIPSRIRGTKTFQGKTRIDGNVRVRQRLNGYRVPDDYVLLNRPQDLTDTEFKCLAPVTVKGDVDVKNHVNGIDLSKEAVLLDHPEPQYISGPKLFTSDVSVEEPVVVGGKVNNINISMMAADTVTTTLDRPIEGIKTFINNVTILKHVTTKTVKGLDIKRMEETTVKINEPAVVSAQKVFRDTVTISGKAQLRADSINGLRFQDHIALANNSKVALGGRTEILGKVTILGNLTVGGKLDGIDLKEVALIKGNQTLCGKKRFTDAVFTNLRYKATDSDIDANVAVVHGNLRVVGQVNGMKLKDLYEDLIFKNESRVVFKAPVTFAKVQSLSGVNVETNGLINGLNITEDFIHGSGINEEITGTKTFTGPTTFNCDLHVQGTFDGINLTEFSEQVVRLEGPTQTISGVKTFVSGVTATRLTDLSESYERLHRPITTEMLEVQGNLNITGKVNGVDFRRLAAKRLTLSTDQVITGSIWMSDANRVKDLRVDGTLNHVNITRLWNDILWKDSKYDQVVTGRKRFTGKVEIPSAVAMRGINGFSIEDVHNAAMYVDQDGINGSHTIVVDGPLTLTGKLNGVDFNELVKDTVMRSQPQLVKGVKVFESLRIKGSLSVEGLVNGLKLERDVLTVNTAQTITGHYTFREDVSLTDSAKVICELSTNQVTFSQGDVETVTLRGNVKTDTLWTGGDLNGIDFIQLWTDAVHTTDSEAVITGTKRFLGSVKFAKNLNVLRTINDFNYPQFLRSIVTTDGRNQIITGLKEFTDSVSIPHMTCHGKVTIHGKLNDNEIESMAALATPVVQTISGNVTIDGNLEVLGDVNFTDTLNGVRIPEDIMTYESDNVVSGRKITKAIHVKGNIIVNHGVNSYNLSALETDTLKVDREQLVTGKKVFKGGVVFGREVKVKESDGDRHKRTRKDSKSSNRPVSEEEKLTFPMNVRFHGRVLFNQGLTINGHVYNNSVATEAQPQNQICSTSECELLDNVLESFRMRANIIDSLQKIQSERGPFTDAKAELVQSEGNVFLAIGFPSCNTPLNIFSWSPRLQNMLPQGTLDLYSVYQILPIQRKYNGHLLVYHRDCTSGENLTSLLAFENGIQPHRVLMQLPTSPPLAVDILVNEHSIIVAKIDSNNNLVIDNVAITGEEVSWSPKVQFGLPVGMSDLKWLPTDGFGRNRFVISNDHRDSQIYLVPELGDVELVQVLTTPGIFAYADISYRLQKAVAFAGSDFIKIYNADADLKEADVLHGNPNISTVSLETLEAGDKLYLVANYGNQVDIYVKEGDSSFLKKLGMSVNGVTFAKMFASEARLYLLTLSSKEWNLSVVLMQGIHLPKMNIECVEKQL